MNNTIPASELILNPDGSIYHLHLLPVDIAETIIFVGDPDRVKMVSDFFDTIEVKKQKREFVTHTGTYKGKRLTVISTGIGTDNIDIVLNELDALVNIDLEKRRIKEQLTTLNIVRLGTSGCLDASIPVDSTLLSSFGFGLDGLMPYYTTNENDEEKSLLKELEEKYTSFYNQLPVQVHFSECSKELLEFFRDDSTFEGITATCTGFYGPQGRQLRLQPKLDKLQDKLTTLEFTNHKLTNFEMETAAIYGLAKELGHKALSINLLIANREAKTFSANPKQSMKQMIQWALDKMVDL